MEGIQRHYWHHCNDDLFAGVHFVAQHHFFCPLVTFVYLRFNETQNNYCSIKRQLLQSQILLRYLGGQHRLATPPLMLRFYHSSPPCVGVVQFKFQANRLRRLPAAPSNPLTGFQILHAFGMHLHGRRSRLHTRIVVFYLATLYIVSSLDYALLDVSIIQNTSFRQHSTQWDALSPTFCKFSVSTLGHSCTSLYFFFLSCNWLTSMPPATASKPNLWRRGPKASHASAPPTVAGSHSSLATVRFLQSILLHLWASLQRYIQQTRQGRSMQTGNTIADTNKQNTLQSSRLPSNEFTTERSRWYNV